MGEGSALREKLVEALKTVKDPEIPVNLWDLGLIYALDVEENGAVAIRMTLTTPNCPVAELLPEQVRRAVQAVEGVGDVRIELVWDPPWTSERMSDDAKLELEMLGITWSDHRGPPTTPLSIDRRKM